MAIADAISCASYISLILSFVKYTAKHQFTQTCQNIPTVIELYQIEIRLQFSWSIVGVRKGPIYITFTGGRLKQIMKTVTCKGTRLSIYRFIYSLIHIFFNKYVPIENSFHFYTQLLFCQKFINTFSRALYETFIQNCVYKYQKSLLYVSTILYLGTFTGRTHQTYSQLLIQSQRHTD